MAASRGLAADELSLRYQLPTELNTKNHPAVKTHTFVGQHQQGSTPSAYPHRIPVTALLLCSYSFTKLIGAEWNYLSGSSHVFTEAACQLLMIKIFAVLMTSASGVKVMMSEMQGIVKFRSVRLVKLVSGRETIMTRLISVLCVCVILYPIFFCRESSRSSATTRTQPRPTLSPAHLTRQTQQDKVSIFVLLVLVHVLRNTFSRLLSDATFWFPILYQ